jgi:putative oxidoreductase
MTIIRRLARPLLAAPLIQSGLDVARHPTPHLENAKPVLDRVSGPLRLPPDQLLVVRVAGGVTAGAGVLLALGRFPRLAALAAVATAPVTHASAPFWQEKDPERRRQKRTELVKNLGLLGGALLASVDTGGQPDLAWRGRRAARTAKRAAAAASVAATHTARATAHDVGQRAELVTLKAEVKGRRAGSSARKLRKQARKQARKGVTRSARTLVRS